MNADAIRDARNLLGLSQAKLGTLLGMSTVTVMRWENGSSTPSACTEAMLRLFVRAETHAPGIGRQASSLAEREGLLAALELLLRVALDTRPVAT